MSYSCIIVDDEPLALDILESYINKINKIKLLKKCTNALDAFNTLHLEHVNLMYVDIKMPEINGIEFIKSLKNPPNIILTTAHVEYALTGYDINAVDYLLKPFSFERFLQATNRAILQLKYQTHFHTTPFIVDLAHQSAFIKSERKIINIDLNDLLYIESKNDYVVFYLKNQNIVAHGTLKSLVDKLPAQQFIRIHRSYIIAINKINAVVSKNNTIEINKTAIPIGNNYREQLFKRIAKRRLL